MTRVSASPYIEWAKLRKGEWNLSASGVPHASLDDIGGTGDMPLSGDNAYGYEPLLGRIAARYAVPPPQVVTATGCSMANVLALAALVEPGDDVLIERPTYEPILLAARHLGASVRRFERRASHGFRVEAEEVAAAITPRTRVVVIANLHNPSSQEVPDEVLRHIGEAAERVGARVLVDEVYLDAVFDQTRRSCVHLGPAFLSTSSLTKVYGLSPLRCGWVIADAALARRIWRVNDVYENVRPFAPDWLAARAFDHLPSLGARTRALLAANRQIFTEWAAARSDVAFSMAAWGTTVCIRPITVDATRLCDELHAEYDVSVVPGRFFELPDHVRVALCAETAVLREGLTRIGLCLDRYRRQDE